MQLCFGSDLESVESLSTSLRVLLVLRVLDIVLDLRIYGVLRMAAWAVVHASFLKDLSGACGNVSVGASVRCSVFCNILPGCRGAVHIVLCASS